MDVVNDITAYLFYDKDFKFVFKETRKHLQDLLSDPDQYVDAWLPKFISDDYLISWKDVYNAKTKATDSYCDFYSVDDKSIKKKILFARGDGIDYFGNNIIIGNDYGIIGLLKFDALPVENDLPYKTVQSIQYKNNSLILYTTIADKVEINISDYSGSLLFSEKEVYLNSGMNEIELNIPLANGVYFCVIKSTTESTAYKFMVCK